MPTATRPVRRTLSPDHYFMRSQEPLQALIFLSPLLIAYEIGALTGQQRVLAATFLRDFLHLFGAVGDYLPGLAIVVVLLCLHLTRRDRWRFEPRLYIEMFFESVAMAIPMVMFGLLLGQHSRGHPAMQTLAIGGPVNPAHFKLLEWFSLSFGAGIYEDFVFRLVAIAFLHFVLVDLLDVSPATGAVMAILCSAVLFGAYHFTNQEFTLAQFVRYFAMGVYLAAVYVLRGFGIVAATHAFYDVLIGLIAQGFLPAH